MINETIGIISNSQTNPLLWNSLLHCKLTVIIKKYLSF